MNVDTNSKTIQFLINHSIFNQNSFALLKSAKEINSIAINCSNTATIQKNFYSINFKLSLFLDSILKNKVVDNVDSFN